MNKRMRELLMQVLVKSEHGQLSTIEELSEQFQVSSRTIRYDIEQINDYLSDKGLAPIILDRQGALRSSPGLQKVRSILPEDEFYEIKLSKEDRLCFEATLLICADSFVTIDDLSEYLLVSRSTIVQDQPALKKLFKDNRLYLGAFSNKGLLLDGEEINRRRLFMKLIRNNKTVFQDKPVYDHLIECIAGQNTGYVENMEIITKILQDAEKTCGQIMTDMSFHIVRRYLEMAWFRIEKGYCIEEDAVGENDNVMAKTIMDSYEQYITNDLPEAETFFLGRILDRVRFIKRESYKAEIIKTQVVTATFIKELSAGLDMNLQSDYILYESLSNHIQSSIAASSFQDNELVNSVITRYPQVVEAIKNNIGILEDYMGREIGEVELKYIALHVCAAFERVKNRPLSYSVVLVCASGVGTAKYLQARLEKYFHVEILDVISAHLIKEFDFTGVDAVIATVPVSDCPIQCITVSPALSDEDCIKIGDLLSESAVSPDEGDDVQEDDDAAAALRAISRILSEGSDDHEIVDSIKQVIDDFFEKEREITLADLLPEEAIRVGGECSDWRGSIRVSAEYLLNNGFITAGFVDKMIRNVEDNGPYIVLAPGFALAHEAYSAGALKLGMSLTRLSTPVPYGKEEMDPVEWVCCLSAIDKESHLKPMFQLMNFLYQPEYRENLQKCVSPHEISMLINRFIAEYGNNI